MTEIRGGRRYSSDRRTYAARNIHLHWVQNWIEMRGRETRSRDEVSIGGLGVICCATLFSIGVGEAIVFPIAVGSVMVREPG